MERLHAALAKMIEDRQGDQITPELWQHCEESARLYAFVDRMLHGCPLPGVDATRIRRISNSLTYFVDRKHLFAFNENNWERQQQAEQEVPRPLVRRLSTFSTLTRYVTPAARDHIALGRRRVQDIALHGHSADISPAVRAR